MNLLSHLARGIGLLLIVMPMLVRADIEFIGIISTREWTRFALGDTASGTTDWVKEGQAFSGYTVVAYEPKDETLLLRREAQELRVRLKDEAKVKPSRLELTGTIVLGAAEKLEIERATLLFDQENVFPLKDGITYRITPTRQPDGTILYRTSIERMLAPNKTERISSPAIMTLAGQPFSMRIGDLEFSFKPR